MMFRLRGGDTEVAGYQVDRGFRTTLKITVQFFVVVITILTKN